MKCMTSDYSGEWQLDLDDERLWYAGREIPLTPKLFALLHYLVTHPQRLLTKQELENAVWPDTSATDDVLKHRILELRQALGDDPERPRFIETVHGRGYRYIGDILVTHSVGGLHPTGNVSFDSVRSGDDAVLIGRERELAELHQRLDGALSGRRQVVCVGGEQGIGKSALIRAFLNGLGGPMAPRIAEGRCAERFTAGEDCLPLLEAIESLCAGPDGETVADDLAGRAPNWLARLPGLCRDRSLSETSDAGPGLPELAMALEALSMPRGLVLALENLHWADAATLEALAYLARRTRPARLLILVSSRPVDECGWATLLTEWRQLPEFSDSTLSPLDEATVAEYLRSRFPGLPAALAVTLHQQSDGNPLFLESLLDHLHETKTITEEDGHWSLNTDPVRLEPGVPDNLRRLVEHRLEALEATDVELLEAASAAGAEFLVTALAAGLRQPVDTVEQRCEALERCGQFLRRLADRNRPDSAVTACYGFRKALYPRVLYDRLSPGRRRELHRRIMAA
ncbi:MAG: winged helix-turn-helix domain-containing protein [Candidatus Competibacterales bacterium]|nr:winged helix-turn-helix domain-containing protein [Candidatus Competibacterales bacterium]